MKQLARVVLVLAASVAALPPSAGAAEVLPDLVADPPRDRGIEDRGTSLVLRMDAYIRNQGAGAVELRGSSLMGGVLTDVEQRIFNDDGSVSRDVPAGAVVRYENHVDHNHFHLQAAARYSLWTEDGAREVLGSEKRGFCLTDSFWADAPKGPPQGSYRNNRHPEFTFCSNNNPNPFDPVVMGISPGWRDDYPASLAFQWVDVSRLTPGRYRLAAEVDPDAYVLESNELNPFAFSQEVSIVPGYRPLRPPRRRTRRFVRKRIALPFETYVRPDEAEPGAPSFAIVRKPRCGRLSRSPASGSFTNGVVHFKAGRRCRGRVSFVFSVRDSTSKFPLTTPTARVRLRVRAQRRTAAG